MALNITVIGTGYVGLVTGACLADLGHAVTCVDNDEAKVRALEACIMPIYEPGLDDVVRRSAERGKLRFSCDLPSNVKGRDAVFIAVGTPSCEADGRADLSCVMTVAEQIGLHIDRFTVVVVKSTVPVGTNRQVQRTIEGSLQAGQTVAVVSNPEFLREGSAVKDFMMPDRVVYGTDHAEAAAVIRQIYAPLEQQGHALLATDIESAELIKYAANAFLAIKLSYINEIADLCESVGANVQKVVDGIGSDRRIGLEFLKPGPGWGGSCFPKDARALTAAAADHAVSLRVVDAAMEANRERKNAVVRKIATACGGSLEGKRVAAFGLTFKGQTDDIRESPSIAVIRALSEQGAKVRAYDPAHPAEAGRVLPGLAMMGTALAAVRNADVLVVLTDWREFVECDLEELAAYMADPVMVDFRNLFNDRYVLSHGFHRYLCVGHKPAGTGQRDECRRRARQPAPMISSVAASHPIRFDGHGAVHPAHALLWDASRRQPAFCVLPEDAGRAARVAHSGG